MPVAMSPIIITSPFGMRVYNKQKLFHSGADLRSANKQTGELINIIAPEDMTVLRNGVDGFGNYFLVCRPESPFAELKFIHMDEKCLSLLKGQHIAKGTEIGFTRVGGNSLAHHLHFEVWQNEAIDPVTYFDFMEIKWKNA